MVERRHERIVNELGLYELDRKITLMGHKHLIAGCQDILTEESYGLSFHNNGMVSYMNFRRTIKVNNEWNVAFRKYR